MADRVQAICPSCKRRLRVPAEWLDKNVSCKHCGAILKPSAAADSPRAGVRPALAGPDLPAAHPTPGFHEAPTRAAPQLPVSDPIIRIPQRFQRGRNRRWLALGAGLALLVTIVTAVILSRGLFTAPSESPPETLSSKPPASSDVISKTKEPSTISPAAVNAPSYPRRLLAICASDYLYANRVGAGNLDAGFGNLVTLLARSLRIDAGQTGILTDAMSSASALMRSSPGKKKPGGRKDTSPEVQRRPPVRALFEKAVTDFLAACRPQDRIIVLFTGHMTTIDGTAYLATLESDLGEKETLLPLSWLFGQLDKCKARQKVLVVDTCRLDPSQGYERPGSGPMPAALASALTKPPAGVQVWVSCGAEQFSYEIDGQSTFLQHLADAVKNGALKTADNPQDPLPMDALRAVVDSRVTGEAMKAFKAPQTPLWAGQLKTEGAAFDDKASMPARIAFPALEPPSGSASTQEVQQIVSELALPPFHVGAGDEAPFTIEGVVFFPSARLAPYKPDYRSLAEVRAEGGKHPLRLAVLDTLDLLRRDFDNQRAGEALRAFYPANAPQKMKEEISKEQKRPARLMVNLLEARDRLDKIAGERSQEPAKRWQAHFDYTRAQVLARIAFLEEYDLMLGKIRKDELPELEKGIHQEGWRLAAREKMQGPKDVRDLANEAHKIWAQVAKEHAGTPWEVLARRAQATSLGLEWRPSGR